MSKGDGHKHSKKASAGGKRSKIKLPNQLKMDLVTWSRNLSFWGVAESANSLHENMHKMHELLVYEISRGRCTEEDLDDLDLMTRYYKHVTKEIQEIEDEIATIGRDQAGDEQSALAIRSYTLEKEAAMLRVDIARLKSNIFKGIPGSEDLGVGDKIIEDIPEDDLAIQVAILEKNIEEVTQKIEELRSPEVPTQAAGAQKSGVDSSSGDIMRFFKPTGEKADTVKRKLSLGGNVTSSLKITTGALAGQRVDIDYSYGNVPKIVLGGGAKAAKADGVDEVTRDGYEKTKINMALANISFVVQYPNGYVGSVAVPVKIPDSNVLNLRHFMALPDFAGKGLRQEEVAFLIAKDTFSAGVNAVGIDYEKYLKGLKPGGYIGHQRSLLDSEQFVFAALRYDENAKTSIVERFLEALSDKGGRIRDGNFVIREMAIDLHSSRYMCDRCVTSAIGMQQGSHDDGSFLSAMVEKVRTLAPANISIDKKCGMSVRVSGGVEHERPALKEESYNTDWVVADKKKVSETDIRHNLGIYKPQVSRQSLSRDLNDYTLFVSGGKELDRFNAAYDQVANFDPDRRGEFDFQEAAAVYQEIKHRKIAGVVRNVVEDIVRHAEASIAAEEFLDQLIEEVVGRTGADDRNPSLSAELVNASAERVTGESRAAIGL